MGGPLHLATINKDDTPLSKQMTKFVIILITNFLIEESNNALDETIAIRAHPVHNEIPDLACDLDEVETH